MSKINPKINQKRNDDLFDYWSIVHLLTSFGLAMIIDPFFALLLVVAWEPLEILVLSPLLAKRGILFGHETLKNSLSDIVFDIVGVLVAYVILK